MNLSIKSNNELKEIINNYKKNNEKRFNMIFPEMDYYDILDKLEIDIAEDFVNIKKEENPDWDDDKFWHSTFDFTEAYVKIGDTIERLIDSYIDAEVRDIEARKEIYLEYLLQIIPFAYKSCSEGQTALAYKHTLKHALELNEIIQKL